MSRSSRRGYYSGILLTFLAFVVLSILTFGTFSLFSKIMNDQFLLSGRSASTRGIVTDFSSFVTTDATSTTFSCSGKLTFQPAEGKPLTVSFASSSVDACKDTFDHEHVTVLYNPGNPSDAGITNFIMQDINIDVFSVGLCGLLMIVFLIGWLMELRKSLFGTSKRETTSHSAPSPPTTLWLVI